MKQFLSLLILLPISLLGQVSFTYTYDDSGRLIQVEADTGQSIEFTLDNRGNLVDIITSGQQPVNSLWPGPLGDKLAGIGWINDRDYPYFWHYSISRFLWIAHDFSTLDSMWGYDLQGGFWFWANDGWGGWHYNANNPNYGIMGWDTWNP